MAANHRLLVAGEIEPVSVVNPSGKGRILLVCEHASRRLPQSLGTLGLSDEALRAHIAWDPGALAVATRMSGSLDATLVHQNFSRLAYDCNRPPEAADAMPPKSEIYDIPGNAGIPANQRAARIDEIYVPWRDRLAGVISDRIGRGQPTVLVTIHSFTPVYKGVRRDVEVGILHDSDSRLADAMLEAAGSEALFDVRRNEPYGPEDGVTHTLKEHGLANGLLNVMIEVRNDLIADQKGQETMADFLTGLIKKSLSALTVGS